jgi:hypothetical protein
MIWQEGLNSSGKARQTHRHYTQIHPIESIALVSFHSCTHNGEIKSTYLTLPAAGAAVAKPLLNNKLLLTALKAALEEAL